VGACDRFRDAFPRREKRDLERPARVSILMRNSSMLLPLSPRRLSCLGALAGLALLAGCGGTAGSRYDDMTATEKAKELKKLRDQAEDQLAIYSQSAGADLEALEKYVDLHRETTKIFPADCPMCFANYGAALSRLGLYYSTLVGKLEEEKERSGATPELDTKIKKYRDLMTEKYQISNQQFEVYFRGDEPVDPKAYYWVFRQYDALKNYRMALNYLNLYEANVTLGPDDKKNAAALRRDYEDAIRREEEQEFERELRREDPASERPSSSRARAEPAN
jgi:hypothetical protein